MILASFCLMKGIFLFSLYRNLKTASSGKGFFLSFIRNFMFLFWRIGCYARLNYYWKPSFCNTQLRVWNVPFYYKILDSASHLSYRAFILFVFLNDSCFIMAENCWKTLFMNVLLRHECLKLLLANSEISKKKKHITCLLIIKWIFDQRNLE